MTAWSSDELRRIDGAEELQVASRRNDGALSSWRTIWVVRDADDFYIRSVNGTGSDWYRATRVRQEGRIRAGGVERDVAFVDIGPSFQERIDSAYRAKYQQYAASLIEAITGPQASGTTMRLLPRA